jgi:hypothetical protein
MAQREDREDSSQDREDSSQDREDSSQGDSQKVRSVKSSIIGRAVGGQTQ